MREEMRQIFFDMGYVFLLCSFFTYFLDIPSIHLKKAESKEKNQRGRRRSGGHRDVDQS